MRESAVAKLKPGDLLYVKKAKICLLKDGEVVTFRNWRIDQKGQYWFQCKELYEAGVHHHGLAIEFFRKFNRSKDKDCHVPTTCEIIHRIAKFKEDYG